MNFSEISKKKKRPVIGVLSDSNRDDYEYNLLTGISHSALKHDCQLLMYIARAFTLPEEDLKVQRFKDVVNIIDWDILDGLMIVTGTLLHHVPFSCIKESISQLKGKPLISFSAKLDDAHLVIADNHQGMYSIVSHLIKYHKKSRIAYINGFEDNTDSIERFVAYRAALEDNGIPMDPELVEKGNFWFPSGKAAVCNLIDNKKIRFDAIIGANDCMAIGAYWELERRGYSIPDEIAVAGFDNINLSTFLDAPLTTVNQPTYRLGVEGLELMLQALKSDIPLTVKKVPCFMVIRKSCACSAEHVDIKQNSKSPEGQPQIDSKLDLIKSILTKYYSDSFPSHIYDAWSIDIEDAFNSSPDDCVTKSIIIVKKMISETSKIISDASIIFDIFSSLIVNIKHTLHTSATVRLLNKISMLISSSNIQFFNNVQETFFKQVSSHVETDLIITTYQFRNHLRNEIQRMNIDTFFFAFLTENGYAKPHYYISNGQERNFDNEEMEFPIKHLFPEHFLSFDKATSFVIVPIMNDTPKQGYFVIPFGILHPFTYGIFAQNLSSLLKTIYFFDKSEKYSKNLESLVENRTRSLLEAQEKLSIAAHQAGMAEIATQLLHNVGNTINSVFSNADRADTILQSSSIVKLKRMFELIQQNKSSLAEFLTNDERGRLIPTYFEKLFLTISEEHSALQQSLDQVKDGLDIIDSIIKSQQKYAEYKPLSIETNIINSIDDALMSMSESILENQINIIKEFPRDSAITAKLQTAKFHHILVNIIRNAIDAMTNTTLKELRIYIEKTTNTLKVTIKDSGCGIQDTVFQNLFHQGFTTKKGHLGFGLHSSINFAREMGGNITLDSKGENEGTQVVIFIPLQE